MIRQTRFWIWARVYDLTFVLERRFRWRGWIWRLNLRAVGGMSAATDWGECPTVDVPESERPF